MKKSLFDNNWVVGLISLFFTLVLFVSVANENNNLASMALTNTSASIDSSVTISNVPVHLGEHDEGTFVSGMPETVSVRLSGPRNIINQISVENFTVQTESLNGMESGVKAIRFEVKGLPESIEYKVTPDLFYGTISLKETIKKKVEFEIADATIEEGYEVGSVDLGLSEVSLSGSADEIKKIAKVMILIFSETPQNTTFTSKYRVQILDANGNPLDINASQNEIEATVNVQPIKKEVSLNIIPVGENENLTYEYQFSSISKVNIYGNGIEDVASVNVIVDVSGLANSGTLVGNVDKIDGITIEPNTVDVDVTIIDKSVSSEETTVIQSDETTIADETEQTQQISEVETTSEENETTSAQ